MHSLAAHMDVQNSLQAASSTVMESSVAKQVQLRAHSEPGTGFQVEHTSTSGCFSCSANLWHPAFPESAATTGPFKGAIVPGLTNCAGRG